MEKKNENTLTHFQKFICFKVSACISSLPQIPVPFKNYLMYSLRDLLEGTNISNASDIVQMIIENSDLLDILRKQVKASELEKVAKALKDFTEEIEQLGNLASSFNSLKVNKTSQDGK